MSLTNLIRIFFIGVLLLVYMFRLPVLMDEFHVSRFAMVSCFCLFGIIFFLPRLKKGYLQILDFSFVGFYLINVASIFWAHNFGEAIFVTQKVFLWFLAYFIFRLSLGLKKKQWALLEKVMLGLTIFTLLFTSFEILSVLHENGFRNRVMYAVKGQAGHKNLVASYLFLLFGVNLFLCFQNGFKKWWYPILGWLIILMLTLHSRSVYLALFVFIIVNSLYYLSTTKYRNTLVKRVLPIGAISIVVLFGLISFTGSKNIYLQYLNPTTYLKSFTAQERFFVWEKTLHLVKDQPLLGYGAGSWKIIFPSKSISGGVRLQEKDVVFTRAHNDFLEVMAEQGIIGFLLYLSIFGFAFWALWATIKKEETTYKSSLVILGSTLFGYAIISGFDFPKERLEHGVLLGLIFAIIAVKCAPFFQSKPLYFKPSLRQWKVYCVLMGTILLINIPISYYRIIGEYYGKIAFGAKAAQNWPALAVTSKKSHQDIWYTLDPIAVPVKWYTGSGYYMQNDYNIALKYFEEAYALNPYNFNVINNYASCLVKLEAYQKAIDFYEKALDINPKFEEGMFNIAYAYYFMKEFDKAVEWVNKTTKNEKKKKDFLDRINAGKQNRGS